MDLHGENFIFGEIGAETTSEKTFEGEVVIADYLSDALRIIKTEAVPRIISKRKGDDKLTVDCIVDIKIWYWSDDGKVLTVNKSESFTEELSVKKCNDCVCVRTSVKTEYVNGQIINSRKLCYKAVISLSARSYCKREATIVVPSGDNHMEYAEKKISVSNMAAVSEKNITVSDIIEVMPGKGEIKEILRTDATVFTVDLKSINNKIITRGQIEVKISYLNVNDRIETVTAEIPFSQIIDIDGMDEDCTPDLKYSVSNISASPRTDENGEMKQISVDAEISVLARGYKNSEYLIATDGYSMIYKCELESEKLEGETFFGSFNSSAADKGFIELSDTLSSVIDVSAYATVIGVSRENDRINVNCAVNCNALITNSANEILNVSRRFETSAPIVADIACEKIRIEPEAKITAVSYSISSDNRLDIKFDVSVDSLVFGGFTENVITSVKINESLKLERKNNAPLVIYYAKKGDKIFNIAKAYRTSKRAIIDANSLSEDILSENKTIIIPIMKA